MKVSTRDNQFLNVFRIPILVGLESKTFGGFNNRIIHPTRAVDIFSKC